MTDSIAAFLKPYMHEAGSCTDHLKIHVGKTLCTTTEGMDIYHPVHDCKCRKGYTEITIGHVAVLHLPDCHYHRTPTECGDMIPNMDTSCPCLHLVHIPLFARPNLKRQQKGGLVTVSRRDTVGASALLFLEMNALLPSPVLPSLTEVIAMRAQGAPGYLHKCWGSRFGT
jgi:hypothetical protein